MPTRLVVSLSFCLTKSNAALNSSLVYLLCLNKGIFVGTSNLGRDLIPDTKAFNSPWFMSDILLFPVALTPVKFSAKALISGEPMSFVMLFCLKALITTLNFALIVPVSKTESKCIKDFVEEFSCFANALAS